MNAKYCIPALLFLFLNCAPAAEKPKKTTVGVSGKIGCDDSPKVQQRTTLRDSPLEASLADLELDMVALPLRFKER